MSFAPEWLALREPADRAARDAALLKTARRWLDRFDLPLVVDIGAGTGSTTRALDHARARWRLVDNDPALLAEAQRRLASTGEAVEVDIADIDALPLADACLVTASALFDLCGVDFVDRLADRLARSRTALYAALNYDGVMEWQPADPMDDAVREAFNRHQRRDKGLGPALGPLSGGVVAEAMRSRGYRVAVAASPWILDAGHRSLQNELLEGIAGAAREEGCDCGEWLSRRIERIALDRCLIGHVDVLALPPD